MYLKATPKTSRYIKYKYSLNFKASYRFESRFMLIEPTLLFIGFLVIFAVLIMAGRIDFSFKTKKE
jgi:hypothetical protein